MNRQRRALEFIDGAPYDDVMPLWNRVRSALGLRPNTGKVAFEEDRVVLRDLGRAKSIPQEPRDAGRRDILQCEQCREPVRRVVFTTAGAGEQLTIWQKYPVAVDGWLCRSCGWSAVPRLIRPEESVAFARHANEHVKNEQFDDAEYWFRRIIASWPGYAAVYADMGQLEQARADAANSASERKEYRARAEAWLRRAVQADAEFQHVMMRVALARALALNGNEREALGLLNRLEQQVELSEDVREEADELREGIHTGRALFTRATDMVRDIVIAPPDAPLSSTDRQLLKKARELLLGAAERRDTFATSWFLGKVELRQNHLDAAQVALERAHAFEPDQPDGCRELASVYLHQNRAEEALPLARKATQLRPKDAGLHCNLAFVLLLTGDVTAARAAAEDAVTKAPEDAISHSVLAMINEVVDGKRPVPKSLAEAEGRS